MPRETLKWRPSQQFLAERLEYEELCDEYQQFVVPRTLCSLWRGHMGGLLRRSTLEAA